MPVPTKQRDLIDPSALRVLITGYGPFRGFPVNPSWLAVKPLHNRTIHSLNAHPRPVHITALQLPASYAAVLAAAPGIHARPPALPKSLDPSCVPAPPPRGGYDLVLHVGVAGPGAMRVEQRGRKHGYNSPDADDELCPVALDGASPVRGFGKGYEEFPDEMYTPVDCAKLIEYLKDMGISDVVPSSNAGLCLCEFITYGSLAEAERAAAQGKKETPVLFIHIPPVEQPLSTEYCTEALRRSISWICSQW